MKFIFILLLLLFSHRTTFAQDVMLSEYSTVFAWRGKDYVNRAHNIELAASLLNGVKLQPGEEFSYNSVVGPRTEKRGFREARVIIGGNMTEGLGGGVCQVSSTLHAAVLYAGLDIIEEHPHSRASTYIDPSLDATVTWGSLDFKFVNNFNFTIRIEAIITNDDVSKKKRLVIKLFGSQNPYNVVIEFKINKKKKFKIKWYVNNNMRAGTRKKREPGTYGYDMERIRIIKDKAGNVISHQVVKYYYSPSDRIWDVGPKEDSNHAG